ncbi:hypothetical protein EDB81DRAFT_754103 [Dactylonectria macrodidyma]|uniref:Carboxylesterase type B domain-containing protein n=1 Tax=Dactylonectria macrodidyma TaxID=307937 RepID=A0A9P9FL96_9HYPO|nr:hypothetical protein EDB81DRAFT_754103 [Dactylonectria macrodidyma]
MAGRTLCSAVGGQLDQVHQNFSSDLGCHEPYDINCLRNPSITADKLGKANVKLFKNVKQTGLFPIGPSVDKAWIKTIPTLAFSQGKFWPNIKSSIISHCGNDAQWFTPDSVKTKADFNAFLNTFLPGTKLASLPQKIANKYDCEGCFKGDYFNCLRHVIRDISFTCNTRDLINAYPQQAYAMSYGFPNDELAYHATDLIPLFANYPLQIPFMLKALRWTHKQVLKWGLKLKNKVVPTFLKYFASFAVGGNPNSAGEAEWPVVNTTGPLFSNVMNPSAGVWALINDTQNAADTCSFWNDTAQAIMEAQGSSGEKTDVYTDGNVQEEL